jgi:hypothetical protein
MGATRATALFAGTLDAIRVFQLNADLATKSAVVDALGGHIIYNSP